MNFWVRFFRGVFGMVIFNEWSKKRKKMVNFRDKIGFLKMDKIGF